MAMVVSAQLPNPVPKESVLENVCRQFEDQRAGHLLVRQAPIMQGFHAGLQGT
jgi:hypothetical protein